MNKLAIDRDIVELLQIRKLTYFGQVSRFECSLRDIHTFFFMDISLEVDLKEDPGKSGLTISRRLFFSGDYTYRHYKICTRQKSVEDPSTQLGLPARGDPVFVAKALSQVK